MKKIALFLTFLVLSIPLYSAVVLAEIRSVSVYGDDRVEGYRRVEGDRSTIDAVARVINDATITPEQLSLVVGQTSRKFSSCTQVDSTYYKCRYTSDGNSLDGPARSVSFDISLTDDAGAVVDTKSSLLTYDNKPPTIQFSAVRQANKALEIEYTARDTACDGATCTGRCSGIREITFGSQPVVVNSSACSFGDVIRIPLAQDGLVTLPVVVVDRLGNSHTTQTPPVLIDAQPPALRPQSVVYLSNGEPITVIGTAGVSNAQIQFTVDEAHLSTVTLDVSMLNRLSHFQESYRQVRATCVQNGLGENICRVNNIFLLPASPQGVISATVIDKAGNTVIQQMPFHFSIDSVSPVVTRIETNGCQGDICYVGAGSNSIRVTLREDGAGFLQRILVQGRPAHRVALDLSAMSSQYTKVWANNCTSSPGTWECYWHNLEAEGPHGRRFTVHVVDGSYDDAGNVVVGALDQLVQVDTQLPIPGNVTFSAGQEKIRFLLEGLPLNADVEVSDDSHVQAFLSSPVIFGHDREARVECSSAGSLQRCIWDGAGTIGPGPIVGAPIRLRFKDLAGNVAELTESRNIVVAEQSAKDYWRVNTPGIQRMPDRINRDTLFFEQKVFFTVPLVAHSSVEVLDIRVAGCSGDTEYLQSQPRVLHRAGRNVYMEAIVAPSLGQLPEVSELAFECTLDIVSLVNQRRLSLPQLLPVTLEVPFASMKLGDLGGNVESLLADARDYQIAGLNGVFGVLEPLVAIFEKICRFTTIMRATKSFGGGIFGGGLGLGNIFGGTGGRGVSQGEQALQAGLRGVEAEFGYSQQLNDRSQDSVFGLQKYCQYITCEKGVWEGAFNKIQGDKGLFGLQESEWSKKRHLGMTPWPDRPQNSLVLSLATGCLPGIIGNLKTYKQIHCQYLDCLENKVPDGLSLQFCTDQFHYLKCRYVYGQVFEIVPYAHFMRRMGVYMKTILANPVSLIFGAGSLCKSKVYFTGLPPAFCEFTSIVASFGTLKQTFNGILGAKDYLGSRESGDDVCKRVGLGGTVK